MPTLKGSKTEKNLMRAFTGESQARNRYTFYAEVAKKENNEYLYHVFTETANNERAHAKVFFDLLAQALTPETEVLIEDGTYPVATGTTEQNLNYAANGENNEWTTVYPEFQKIAEEEGFKEVAIAFKHIIEVEKSHYERYKLLYQLMKENKLYKRDEEISWRCMNCGYIYEGTTAPLACPLCKYPQGYYERYYGTEQ